MSSLLEFIDWRCSQSCSYFRPLLWTSAPLTFSLAHLSPPSLCQSTVYHRQCVAGWVLRCVGDRILQEFNTLYLTRFRTYKIALPLPNKNLGGKEPQTDKHLPPSTFTGQFWRKAAFGFGVFIDIWSKRYSLVIRICYNFYVSVSFRLQTKKYRTWFLEDININEIEVVKGKKIRI